MARSTTKQIVRFVTGPRSSGKSTYLAELRHQAEGGGRPAVEIVVTAISMPQLVHELHVAPRNAVVTIDDAEMGVFLCPRAIAEIAQRHARGRDDLDVYIASALHPLAHDVPDATF